MLSCAVTRLPPALRLPAQPGDGSSARGAEFQCPCVRKLRHRNSEYPLPFAPQLHVQASGSIPANTGCDFCGLTCLSASVSVPGEGPDGAQRRAGTRCPVRARGAAAGQRREGGGGSGPAPQRLSGRDEPRPPLRAPGAGPPRCAWPGEERARARAAAAGARSPVPLPDERPERGAPARPPAGAHGRREDEALHAEPAAAGAGGGAAAQRGHRRQRPPPAAGERREGSGRGSRAAAVSPAGSLAPAVRGWAHGERRLPLRSLGRRAGNALPAGFESCGLGEPRGPFPGEEARGLLPASPLSQRRAALCASPGLQPALEVSVKCSRAPDPWQLGRGFLVSKGSVETLPEPSRLVWVLPRLCAGSWSPTGVC